MPSWRTRAFGGAIGQNLLCTYDRYSVVRVHQRDIKNCVPYNQVVRPKHIIRVTKNNEHAGSSRGDE